MVVICVWGRTDSDFLFFFEHRPLSVGITSRACHICHITVCRHHLKGLSHLPHRNNDTHVCVCVSVCLCSGDADVFVYSGDVADAAAGFCSRLRHSDWFFTQCPWVCRCCVPANRSRNYVCKYVLVAYFHLSWCHWDLLPLYLLTWRDVTCIHSQCCIGGIMCLLLTISFSVLCQEYWTDFKEICGR